MSNETSIREEKSKKIKIFIKTLIIVSSIILLLLIAFSAGFLMKKSGSANTGVNYVLENPLKAIILANTNANGELNKDKVIEQGVLDFNEKYINYILVALGVNSLHSSILAGNPKLELVAGDIVWNSEIIEGSLKSKQGAIDDEDLKITMSKEEAVKAILSPDIKQFMKESVISGNTQIEMVANKISLYAKGYLDMYEKLKGEEISA